MKRIYLGFLLFFMFYCNNAQTLESKYYSSYSQLFDKYLFQCSDSSCIIQLVTFEHKNSTKIHWSDTITISNEYLNEVKRLFKSVSHLHSTESARIDGIIGKISGVFENDTLQHSFVCQCPFRSKGREIQYDFFEKSVKLMQKVFKKRKSKGFARLIRWYIQ